MNPQLIEDNKRKIIVIGDYDTGKTSLFNVYCTGEFKPGFNLTCYESYDIDIKVDEQNIEVELWEPEGQEWQQLRPLSHPETHVFLICFSIDSPESLVNVAVKWIPELLHFCPHTPYILVGCKSDLRQDRRRLEELEEIGLGFVSKEEGEAVARRIGASMYLECSAKTDEGLAEVVNHAARISISTRRRASRDHCVIL